MNITAAVISLLELVNVGDGTTDKVVKILEDWLICRHGGTKMFTSR